MCLTKCRGRSWEVDAFCEGRDAALGARPGRHVALDPGLLKTSLSHPVFPQTFLPQRTGSRARQLIPAFQCFNTTVRVFFFQLASCSAQGGYSQPPEERGKREQSSQLRRNVDRAPPPSRSQVLERVLTLLFIFALSA